MSRTPAESEDSSPQGITSPCNTFAKIDSMNMESNVDGRAPALDAARRSSFVPYAHWRQCAAADAPGGLPARRQLPEQDDALGIHRDVAAVGQVAQDPAH